MARSIRNTRDLGAFIHDARAQLGLTQQQLADKAGVSRTWLIGVEHGQRPGAELGKIFALLQALDLDMTLEVQKPPHHEASPSATSPHRPTTIELPKSLTSDILRMSEMHRKKIQELELSARDFNKRASLSINRETLDSIRNMTQGLNESLDFDRINKIKQELNALAAPSPITLALRAQTSHRAAENQSNDSPALPTGGDD